MLHLRDEPFLYRFSANAMGQREPKLGLVVSREGLDKKPAIEPEAPILEHYRKKFSWLNSFSDILQVGSKFGFNEGLNCSEHLDGVLVELPLPAIEKVGGKCPSCKGSGKDSLGIRDECMRCDGRQFETEHSLEKLTETAVSLSILLHSISLVWYSRPFDDTDRVPPPHQLLTVSTHVDYSLYGGALDGAFSIPLVRWLSTFPAKTRLQNAEKKMRVAWDHFYPSTSRLFSNQYFAEVSYEDGWLNVSCPGNACGLNPTGHRDKGRGYEFACHNTDTLPQQFTLLACLAEITDMAFEANIGQ